MIALDMMSMNNDARAQLFRHWRGGVLASIAPLLARAAHMTSFASDVAPGDIFVACRGERTHGIHYWQQANRPAAIIWDSDGAPSPLPPLVVPNVGVPGLTAHANALINQFYGRPDAQLPLYAVTGTNGKTSASHYIAAIATAAGERAVVCGTVGNGLFGHAPLTPSRLTTPDIATLARTLRDTRNNGGATLAVCEVSSHALATGRLDGITIDTAVYTTFTRDHLDFHKTMAAYAAAKLRLVTAFLPPHVVVNCDDPLTEQLLPLCREQQLVGYSLGSKPPPVRRVVRADNVSATPHGLEWTLVIDDQCYHVVTPVYGRFQVGNMLAAVAALAARLPQLDWSAVLGTLTAPPGRMQPFVSGNGVHVFVDYAHTPDGIAAVIASCRQHFRDARITIVFGCGGDRDAGKRPLMGAAACAADQMIVTDDNPRSEAPSAIANAVITGIPATRRADVRIIHDRFDATATAITAARAGDVVIIAGKGHERTQHYAGRAIVYSDIDKVQSICQSQ